MIPKNFSDLFNAFDSNRIKFCSWKNNHQLEEVFKSGVDLDVLISDENRQKALSIFNELGWFNLYNPSVDLDSIFHFYKYNGHGFHHIHLYFKLYTGHSWLKEYDLPFVTDILKFSVKEPNFHIPVPCKSHAESLYLFREVIKKSSLSGRFLYMKDADGYQDEALWISKCMGREKAPSIIVDLSVLSRGSIPELQKFRRYSKLKEFFLVGLQFFVRASFKFIGIKKLIPLRGKIVVITGPDGSGKTTLVDKIHRNHSSIQKTYKKNLGRPYGVVLNNVISSKSRLRRKSVASSSQDTLHEIKAVLIAFLRLYAAIKCYFYKTIGILVLCDRWPSGEQGSIDGPRIRGGSGAVGQMLFRLENLLYRNIPKADMTVRLQVNVDTALQRNSLRIKHDKETDGEIRDRHKDSLLLRPLTHSSVDYVNEFSVDEAVSDLEEIIARMVNA